ncbi:type II CRISPR RNA-guided endonuclease Cas9, partial [uncultured Bartonella sp.]|uniref:type II CRISPR RNA-guided endonuclease Cas9 n=1 Tax=uncultured Bartonella sp. TaxID=104108 RepID=UPI003441DB6B
MKATLRRNEKLKEIGQKDNGYNRKLLKLWEELDEDENNRVSIYTGTRITQSMLFSDKVEIDHILPFSRTLDDSNANRILCLTSENRFKGNHAPSEVTQWRKHYDEIIARAQKLPKSKQWRFAPDAMDKMAKNPDFLARRLTDTQYLARLSREYLDYLYPGEEADENGELKKIYHVWSTTGKITELLRRNWKLNSLLPIDERTTGAQKLRLGYPKNRSDHRHHAIDAIVIGVTKRSLLKSITDAASRL